MRRRADHIVLAVADHHQPIRTTEHHQRPRDDCRLVLVIQRHRAPVDPAALKARSNLERVEQQPREHLRLAGRQRQRPALRQFLQHLAQPIRRQRLRHAGGRVALAIHHHERGHLCRLRRPQQQRSAVLERRPYQRPDQHRVEGRPAQLRERVVHARRDRRQRIDQHAVEIEEDAAQTRHASRSNTRRRVPARNAPVRRHRRGSTYLSQSRADAHDSSRPARPAYLRTCDPHAAIAASFVRRRDLHFAAPTTKSRRVRRARDPRSHACV